MDHPLQRRMLSGTYECALDNRHRLAIPAKLRDGFNVAGASMSLWFDGCLILVPRLEWPGIVERTFGVMNVLDDDQRRLSRLLHAYTFEQDVLDRQGRVAIPEKLRQEAGIDGTVTVVGVGDHLELWNPQRLEKSFEELRGEGVSSLGNRIAARAA